MLHYAIVFFNFDIIAAVLGSERYRYGLSRHSELHSYYFFVALAMLFFLQK